MKTASLMTVAQVAAALGVRRPTVYDWCYRGLLPHVRILAGAKRAAIRFRSSDLDRFIAERTVASRRMQ